MSAATAWAALIAAGSLDVGWAITMKLSDGYARAGWNLASLVFLAAFVFLLGRALAVLPLGAAYVAWTGVGAVGTVAAGAMLFSEGVPLIRLVGIAVVVVGIVLLKLNTADRAAKNLAAGGHGRSWQAGTTRDHMTKDQQGSGL